MPALLLLLACPWATAELVSIVLPRAPSGAAAGGHIFQAAEFGSSAATAPEGGRVEATQALTRRALAYAQSRGLHVAFALDIDTESADPQNIILTLPQSARFFSGKLWLPNPDTPEGYEYFKAQVRQLLTLYPQIDRLVVWFRHDRTLFRTVRPEDFPAAWQMELQAALSRNPAMESNKDAPSMFAIARVSAAFSRALSELKRADVELGCGTWRPDHLPAAHAFFGPGIKFYWLDWRTEFDQPRVQALENVPATISGVGKLSVTLTPPPGGVTVRALELSVEGAAQ